MKTAENLRKWAYEHESHGRITSDGDGYDELLDIADSMEAELKAEAATCMQDMANSVNIEYVYTYKDAEELCRKAFDAGADYVRTCKQYNVNAIGYDWEHWAQENKHLFMPTPTVEDVLREFADKMNENMGMYTGEAIDADEWRDADRQTIAEYAAKLRLAGDAE